MIAPHFCAVTHIQPLFIFVTLNPAKACLLQIHFQISIRIDGHTVNDLRPFVVFCCFAVCFVTDEKSPAGLQHPIDLSEILRKLRPEIDRFKCGCHIKLLRFKRQLCHACLLHIAPSFRNGTRIDLSRFFYADSRVVNALYLSLGTQFQQLFDVRPTAAAAVQHHGIRGRLQKVQPPFCHCAVSKVHHGNHDLPAKACRLAGVFKKGHNSTFFLFPVHNAMLFTRCAHCSGWQASSSSCCKFCS